MLNVDTIPSTRASSSPLERIGIVLVLVYQAIALVVFALIPLQATDWIRTPFPGVFFEHTLVTNGTRPLQSTPLPDTIQWLYNFGNQLLAVEGQPVRTADEVMQALRKRQPGDIIQMTLETPGGEQKNVEVPLQRFSRADQLGFLLIPYLLGLFYLGCSLWVFSIRRQDVAGRAFAFFATSTAIGLGSLFDLYTTHRFTFLWSLAIAFAGGGIFILALVFPEEIRLLKKRPVLRWLPLVPAIALALFTLPTLFNLADPRAYAAAWRYEYIFSGIGVLFFLGWLLFRGITSQSPITREQARIILLGAGVAFLPLATWFFSKSFNPETKFSLLLFTPIIAFPVATGYTILRYRLLNTDYLLSRAGLYALLSVLSISVYVFLVWGSSLILGKTLPANHPILIGLMIFIIAAFFLPLRERLQRGIDTLFFRGQAVYQENLQKFSHELTQVIDLSMITSLLRKYVEESLAPRRLDIFLHDPLSDQYAAATDHTNRPTTDIRFPVSSALVQMLTHDHPSLFLGDASDLPPRLAPDKVRLVLLGAQLYVALPGQKQLLGWLALGPRLSGEPYARRDLAFVEALSDQAALAIERAQVVFDLERRVHALDVLARVAQGVNVTIKFDDVLELIYAQTLQIVRGDIFRITLFNQVNQAFYHAFYLENDERLPQQENRSLPDGYGLEQMVVQEKRAIITVDYERECRNRGIIPAAENIFGWIGVPLNTGAETIGAISLGSHDPAITYTSEQQNLLQAIADQAAGAIVKTQLLQESEQRTLQLVTLNRVARSLTSTLDINLLLNRILESAVEILTCEAGSLFLVDEQTGELVFEVTVGPVADDLVGMRLPPGTGLVGRAVDTRQAIIDNNVQKSKDWFDKTDQETGFITRALLVVPIQVRDQVIGVLEVINKMDRSPFSADDERLLTAFASQAGVAIQNARLFTMTDEALAARVDELSVMQRIDRELNTSLDVDRAMHITLDWAMRQSEADLGLIGMVEKGNIRVIKSMGVDELDHLESAARIANFPVIQTAIRSGQPERGIDFDVSGTEAHHRLLPEAQSQLAIPIWREEEVFGMLYLESTQGEKLQEDAIAFLTRLCDHAAIAISNAQLYAEVQSANVAKSDFVSFVSHELKTPMTSIRGFTDLLAAGAVGTVNEAQAGFLHTIRTNVDRMTVLVSDLADVSRIEAGRLRLEFGAVSLAEVIDEVVLSAKQQVEEKKQTLTLRIQENLPMVWGDRNRIVQILTNLVNNAHKYTPEEGEITIRAEALERDQAASHGGSTRVVQVAVQDTGIGIKPEDKKQIFTKFFRSDDQKAREAPGTGLGLNITKNLIELQGGQIWFESEFRKGTTFYFTIPVAETT